MATSLPRERSDGPSSGLSETWNERIGEQVLRALGRPPNLHAVQVRSLWGKFYRVNVLVGTDASCATVGHSYFVEADDGGGIAVASPLITRWY